MEAEASLDCLLCAQNEFRVKHWNKNYLDITFSSRLRVYFSLSALLGIDAAGIGNFWKTDRAIIHAHLLVGINV